MMAGYNSDIVLYYVRLLSSILDLAAAIDSIYESNELQDKIIVKTAVGSPGFIEMIAPCFTPGMTGIVFMLCLAKCVLGKARDKNGITSDGILGVITKFNELLNDHELRKKTRAETKFIY